MSNTFTQLIREDYFDAFTWVPTVQGNLCIKLLKAKALEGLFDKYLVNFEYNPDPSKPFDQTLLVATMIDAEFDQKYWPTDFSGVFRYIIHGTLNFDEDISNFIHRFRPQSIPGIDQDTFDKDIRNSFLGNILILHNENPEIPELEHKFLIKAEELARQNKIFNNKYNNEAASFKELNSLRSELYLEYLKLRKIIGEIERVKDASFYYKEFPKYRDKENQYRVWNFSFLLSEDGLLYLKNDTASTFASDFAFKEDARYSLSRVYKMAAVRVKHLFHQHYHHPKQNDTYITVSNLDQSRDTHSIALNQIRGISKEIIKLKRERNFGFTNIKGISAYADSLSEIFRYRGFITQDFFNQQRNLLKNLRDDAIVLEEKFNGLNKFLARNGIQGTITWFIPICAFLLALVDFSYNESIPDAMIIATIITGIVLPFIIHHIAILSAYKEHYISKVYSWIEIKRDFTRWDTIKRSMNGERIIAKGFRQYLKRQRNRLKNSDPKERSRRNIVIYSILFFVAINCIIAVLILYNRYSDKDDNSSRKQDTEQQVVKDIQEQ